MLLLLLKMHSDRYHAANLCQPPRFLHSPPGPGRPPYPPFPLAHQYPLSTLPALPPRRVYAGSTEPLRSALVRCQPTWRCRPVRSVNVNAVRYLAVAPVNGSGAQIQVHSIHRCITQVQKCIVYKNHQYYYYASSI